MSRRRAARHAVWVSLALSCVLGCREEPPPEIVKNTCLADVNCGGGDETCEQSTLMCVRLHTVEPYRVMVQVQPEILEIELPDGGLASLVAQAALELGTLDGGREDAQLEVPGAVRVQGRVEGVVDGAMRLLESELTLMPRMGEAELRSTVVNSAQYSSAKDDAGMDLNVEALLDPSLTYDLRVQPLLLSASTQLPPFRSSVPYEPGQPLNIEYGEIVEREARLTSSDFSWAGQRVRLEDVASGQVVSSIVEVQGASVGDAGSGSDGRFALYAEPEIFAEPSKFKLAVELSGLGFPRWQMKLALDGSRFLPNAAITLPRVPRKVTIEGTVRNADNGAVLPNASLEFVSDFPVDEDYVGEGNWCRLHPDQPSPELSCSAQLSASANTDGRFEIELLPGLYDVFVLPDRAASPDRATFAQTLRVESSPGFMPQSIEVNAATRYDGVVRSPQEQPMPNVTVNAQGLGVYEPEFSGELNAELSQYNRNATAVTDADGKFSLYPDIGRYDFSIETPPESGFAWMLCPNYSIRPRDRRTPQRVTLRPFYPPTPVILAGSVEHQGVKLANARIEAYAVWETEPPRLLLVARGTSDAEGRYRLAMPPQLPPAVRDESQTCPIRLEPPVSEQGEGGLTSIDSGLVRSDAGTARPDSGALNLDSGR